MVLLGTLAPAPASARSGAPTRRVGPARSASPWLPRACARPAQDHMRSRPMPSAAPSPLASCAGSVGVSASGGRRDPAEHRPRGLPVAECWTVDRKPPMRPVFRTVLWLLAALLALIAVAWGALAVLFPPARVRVLVSRQLSATLSRDVRFADASLGLWPPV